MVRTRLRAAAATWVGERQYAVGKHCVRFGWYADAVKAFEAAEGWYTQNYGSLHPYVAAALMRQGWCNAKLGRLGASCRAYDRALQIIEATEGPVHPKAREIRDYLAAVCG